MEIFEILSLVAAIIFLLYCYETRNYKFWKNQDVKGPKPWPLVGNFKDVLLDRLPLVEMIKNLYDQYDNEQMIGIYARSQPILILKDLELIKDILIKDFNKFPDRGIKVHEKIDPLSQNLVKLESKRWRPLRKKISSIFTTGKLKDMFYLLLECSNHLDLYLKKIVPNNEPIECRLLTSKFTTNIIGSCAFGIDVNSFSDGKNDFIRMGEKIFDVGFWKSIKIKIRDLLPDLYSFLGGLMKDREMDNFFIDLVTDTIKYRKENDIIRHDFIDLLRFMKDDPKNADDIEMTDTLVAAQAYIFFAAGFETTSATMSNALYELALNSSIQDKLRKEIQEILSESNGNLTYDNVKSMKYLHKILQETLRKYPPAFAITRMASEQYTFSGTNVTIPKNTFLCIPVCAIQWDHKYYPNPEIFDPERFNDEEVKARHPMLHLPFGEGPRICIGARFAVLQAKIGLVKILQNYQVDKCEKTPMNYITNPRSYFLVPMDGLYLKFSKIS